MTPAEVAALLPDNTPWSIVQRETVDVLDEQGHPTGETKEVVNEYDNSEYSLSGDITDHRDGTVSIKMGSLRRRKHFGNSLRTQNTPRKSF